MSKSQDFLNAFNRIENHLRKKSGAHKYIGFSDLLRNLEKVPEIKHYRLDLQSYSDLRNAIVHRDPSKTTLLAEPTDQTVIAIKKLSDLIVSPPNVMALKLPSPITCGYLDPVSRCLDIMGSKSISALPVISEEGVALDVITAQCLLNFLASKTSSPDSSIQACLSFRDKSDVCIWVSRDVTLISLIDQFHEKHQQGQSLILALVTERGWPTERLLKVVSPTDLLSASRLINFS